ncbi:SpoIIE family protein phosphatase [Spirulina sp. CS-785/01]|uniref:PP2C family protein-serine/threonine phosphatase n=1 Tax=Spirulina sp. CS-785/01 TaxID=3021716 RepID=UPI00232D7CF1|nr:GAF domain-containing SpoIIE family protein phosphatase [Spirulina sp. CS-785/01]MDB9312305.1 SpoIIE family protein phosphatase [Spirulina sp. CS-785/01]
MIQESREKQLLAEIAQLQEQVAQLTTDKKVFEAQQKLLKGFVALARAPTQERVLRHFLQQTLTLAVEMTQADRGSLFLIDSTGRVEDAILSRQITENQEEFRLYSQVIDKGLAGWVVQHKQIGLIADTELDDRWLQLPDQLYTARSVLCVPLLKGTEILGILTLLHPQAFHFGQESVELIRALADQMSIVVENAQLYSRLRSYSQTLNEELEKGQEIQVHFLPTQVPQRLGWEIATFFQPARRVAGDFYDVFELSSNQIGFIIADVCDKGVGAALFMGLFRSLIRIFSGQTNLEGLNFQTQLIHQFLGETDQDHLDVEGYYSVHLNALRAIRLTNDYIAINHGDLGMFATLFFGVLDPTTGNLTYINSGHEALLLCDRTGQVKAELTATAPALGIIPHLTYQVGQVQLEQGDFLLGFTDGVTEARNADGKFFGKARLLEALCSPFPSVQDLLQHIATEVGTYTGGADQFDDMTMIAVRRNEGEGEWKG